MAKPSWQDRINDKKSPEHKAFWQGYESGKEQEQGRIKRMIRGYMANIQDGSTECCVLHSLYARLGGFLNEDKEDYHE